MKIEDLKLKELTLITDYEEIKELYKNLYGNKSMIDFLYKKYYFFKSKDNKVIHMEKYTDFHITKTIWYDDECEAPEKNLENFLDRQSWTFNNIFSEENLKAKYCYILVQGNEKANVYSLHIVNNIYSFYNFEYLIHLRKIVDVLPLNYDLDFENYSSKEINSNVDLIEDLKAIINFNNDNMLERLKKYYDRYKDKIHVEGYWANR